MNSEDTIVDLNEDPAFDLLIRATEALGYRTRMLEPGDVVLDVAGKQIRTTITSVSIEPQKFEIEVLDGGHQLWNTTFGPTGGIRPGITARDPRGSWELGGHGYLTESRMRDHLSFASIRFFQFDERARAANIAATTIVYVGAPGVSFPQRLPVPSGVIRPHFLERALRVRVAGRDALVRSVDIPELSGFGRSLAVSWIGPILPKRTLNALQIVMSFLLGERLQPAMQLAFDGCGSLVSTRIDIVRSRPDRKHTPPIDPHRVRDIVAAGASFEEMIARCERMEEAELFLGVAIGHLFKDDPYLDDQIRDVTLALNSIIASKIFRSRKGWKISTKRFEMFKAAIVGCAELMAVAGEEPFIERIGEVLTEARRESPRMQEARFWKAVGFRFTRDEAKARKHRNPMSHDGFIKFDYDNDEEWSRLTRDLYLVRTLTNRAILALLGYDGDAVSYVDGGFIHVDPASEDFLRYSQRVPSESSG